MIGPDEGDLFARYCLPGNRYKKLLSGSFMRAGREHALRFGAAMLVDGRRASAAELEHLLAGDWREVLTACWLIGFAKRFEFRAELHGRLQAGEVRRIGKGIAFALARFCERSDAQVLRNHLQDTLSDPRDRGDQPWFLGALMSIETRLGMSSSSDLLVPDGLWDRWSVAGFLESGDPAHWEREVGGWLELAESLE